MDDEQEQGGMLLGVLTVAFVAAICVLAIGRLWPSPGEVTAAVSEGPEQRPSLLEALPQAEQQSEPTVAPITNSCPIAVAPELEQVWQQSYLKCPTNELHDTQITQQWFGQIALLWREDKPDWVYRTIMFEGSSKNG